MSNQEETKEEVAEAPKEEDRKVVETQPAPPSEPEPTPKEPVSKPATEGEAWTQPVQASPEVPAETSSRAEAGSAPTNGASPHPESNGASREHLMGHKICVLSLPQGQKPVNEEVARCIGPFAPHLARAVAAALRASGAKVTYPVTVLALDTSKSGEAAITHNERV